MRGLTLDVESPVESREGFHYTRITRFGHRVSRIYARNAQALRFTIGGRTIFRRSVRGYHPTSDWVQGAVPRARHEVASSASYVGRTVAGRIAG
jgi:hypothetical protein